METSRLFKCLNAMPKGALHHIHTTAAVPISAYMDLTKDDRTYFNFREGMFEVYPKTSDEIKSTFEGASMGFDDLTGPIRK